jgi:outer membrane protein TolC
MIFLSLFVAGSLAAQTPRVLTLEHATAVALERSRILGIGRARAEAERARAAEASSSRYAGLSLVGSYTRIEEGTFKLSTTNLQAPLPVGPVPVNNYVLRLGLRQPLFTGFRLSSASDAASLQAEASQWDVTMIREDLTLNVASAYWTLYQARQMERYAGENVGRLESYLRDTERLVASGVLTRNDLLRVQVQHSSARIAHLEAKNNAWIALMNLNNVMGEPAHAPVELASAPMEMLQPDTLAASPESLGSDELVGLALRQRPDLHAAATRVRAAGASTGTARGLWWPQIDLVASYNYNNPNARYQPITKEFLGSWDVGVTFAFDLWNWGATASRVEQAEAALRQNELQERQLKENVVLEVSRATLNFATAKEKLSVADLAVAQASENLRILSDKYRTGLATSTELLDAEVALVSAQTQQSGAQVEAAIARAMLTRAVGGLRGGGA